MELLSCIGFPSAIIIIHEDCGGKMQNSCTIGKVTINKPCTKQKITKQKAGGLSRLLFLGGEIFMDGVTICKFFPSVIVILPAKCGEKMQIKCTIGKVGIKKIEQGFWPFYFNIASFTALASSAGVSPRAAFMPSASAQLTFLMTAAGKPPNSLFLYSCS